MGNKCGRMKVARRSSDHKKKDKSSKHQNHQQKPLCVTPSPNEGAVNKESPLMKLVHQEENGISDLPELTVNIDPPKPKNGWIQLAGHPDVFETSGPNTILKKQTCKELSEAKIYRALAGDSVQQVIPKFYREIERENEVFVEMENLLVDFSHPNIMDIKMGTRTFLESEVENPALRSDLYEKMIKLDPAEPTPEENSAAAITKLRYMQFRENSSTSASLGFRIDAIRLNGGPNNNGLLSFSSRQEVQEAIVSFTGRRIAVCRDMLERLKDIRQRFESSAFFKRHEIIGSSLLVICDDDAERVGVWMIDFAKIQPLVERSISHRSPWQLGNNEDGYLTGLDSLIEVVTDIVNLGRDCKNPSNGISSEDITTHFPHSSDSG